MSDPKDKDHRLVDDKGEASRAADKVDEESWLDASEYGDLIHWIDASGLTGQPTPPRDPESGPPEAMADTGSAPDGAPSPRRIRWRLREPKSGWDLTFKIRLPLDGENEPGEKP